MVFSIERLKARRNVARREHDSFKPMRDEAYQYAIPFRKSTRDGVAGEKRVDQVFDHTAIDSAFRFAGKYQQDLWPAGQQNFSLEPGPFVVDAGEREVMKLALEQITKVCQSFFEDGDWDLAFHEMALELGAGTGAILMNSTPDMTRLWDPMSVSIDELMLEAGANGKIGGRFWDRKMPVRVLFDTWPEGDFGAELKRLLKERPEEEIVVHLDTVWHPKLQGGRWVMMVWCDKQETLIHQSRSRSDPWLTPRYFRVPGETYGRGPIMLAMPTIKTLNTAARLQLQAAAIAMLGIYTAVDDGVFNPDLSELAPGSFWKVARNGGPMGPSVNRFPDPRLDLTGLVVENMQMNVKATLMDQALPVEGAAVKSATEILERVKRLAADHMGAFGRQIKEVVEPAVKRVIELAYNKGMIRSQITIDQLLIKVKVKSPLAIAKEMQRTQKIVQWLETVLAICAATGSDPRRIAQIDAVLVELGEQMGVDQAFITSQADRKQMDEAAAKAAAAENTAKLAFIAANGKAPPEPAKA